MDATKNQAYPVGRIQNRLRTGLGNKGGARGSLTRCAGRLSGVKRAWAAEPASETKQEEENKDDGNSPESLSQACDLMARELKLARVEMIKLLFLSQRQQQEEQQESATATAATDTATIHDDATLKKEQEVVQQLRQDLKQASSTVAAQKEYEQTAQLLCAQHPTPVATLRGEIRSLQGELQQAQRDLHQAQSHTRIRQAQFQLLMQCMLDLKQSLTEPLPDQDDSGKTGEGKEEEEDEEKEKTNAGEVEGDVVMKEAQGNEEEEDEGALYDDL